MWSNNGDVLREAAIRGQGVAMLPMFLIGGELQEGRLQRVLPEYSMSPLDISVLYPRHRYLSDKVRTLVEFIKKSFVGTPPWALVD
jgi:DNA-binding transcriptional LysR family regulator